MKILFQGKNNDENIKRIERILGASFISKEVFPGIQSGHKFSPGDKLELYGLEDYPQFNGEIVTVSSIREDGPHGKAYYFTTQNEALASQMNWTYQYRLRYPNKPLETD